MAVRLHGAAQTGRVPGSEGVPACGPLRLLLTLRLRVVR